MNSSTGTWSGNGKSAGRRTALTAVALACAAAAAGLAAPQQASAASSRASAGDVALLVAKDTRHLVMIDQFAPSRTVTDTLLTVAPGTSPAIAGLTTVTDGWVGAFQSSANELWLGTNSASFHDTRLPMAPGTSPAAVGLDATGSYIVAYVAPDYRIHLYQNGVDTGTGANIIVGTSPAIARTARNTWEVAFHGQDNVLWLFGPDMAGHMLDGGLGIAAGTSPSIVRTDGSVPTFSVAWNAQGDNDLWIAYGLTSATADWNNNVYDTRFEMDPASNPSISRDFGQDGPISVEWNALPPGDALATATVGQSSIGIPLVGPKLAPGTSPCYGDGSDTPIAYERADGDIIAGNAVLSDTGIAGAPDSSPVIAALWN